MPKPIKYDELYNKPIDGIYPKLKERFLNTISESTRNTYRYILAKAYRMELSLDKDIYEFSWNELDSLIRIYSNKSMQSVATNVSCLRDYINFCIREGFVHDMVNYLDSVGGEDYLKQYIDVRASENKYPTREQLIEIQNRLTNARDVVILELLFISLTSEELFNLKVSDCNMNEKTLIVTRNNGTKRELNNLSDYTISIIQDAINENEYTINNGSGSQSAEFTRPEVYKLYNREYIVKNTREGGFTQTSLTNLIAKIKILTDEPYLTPTNLRIAGLIDCVKKIKEENGELNNENYKYLMKKFGFENINYNSISILRRKIQDYI